MATTTWFRNTAGDPGPSPSLELPDLGRFPQGERDSRTWRQLASQHRKP